MPRRTAPAPTVSGVGQVYALQILGEILGGGSTSRLYQALAVRQGIAATAGAWYDPETRGPGDVAIFGSPRPGHNVTELEAAMDDEIARLLKDGVTAQEVTVAIQRLKDAATKGENVFAVLMDAVQCCSLGQISDALFEAGGKYRRNM